jgi:hypothetical protein
MPPSAPIPDFDVFLSCKQTGPDGRPTRDSAIARHLETELEKRGIRCFRAESAIQTLGRADYSRAIMETLDRVPVVVVVGTTPENVRSSWVRFEWETFLNEVRSGRKLDGVLISVVEGISISDLPLELRQWQCFVFDHRDASGPCDFLARALGNRRPQEGLVEKATNTPDRKSDGITPSPESHTEPLGRASDQLQDTDRIRREETKLFELKQAQAFAESRLRKAEEALESTRKEADRLIRETARLKALEEQSRLAMESAGDALARNSELQRIAEAAMQRQARLEREVADARERLFQAEKERRRFEQCSQSNPTSPSPIKSHRESQPATKHQSTIRPGAKIFISHSSRDLDLCEPLVRIIELAGFPCWYAGRDLMPAATGYHQRVLDAIEGAWLVIVLVSPHALSSEHVKNELDRATNLKRPFLPLHLKSFDGDLQDVAYFLGRWQHIKLPCPPERIVAAIEGLAQGRSSGCSP